MIHRNEFDDLGITMIEINDAKLSHYMQRVAQERAAAAAATNQAVRELHLRIAEMYERQAATFRSKS